MAYFYKETRVGMDWARPSVTFEVKVPDAKKEAEKGMITENGDIAEDEEIENALPDDEYRFSYQNLATAASVHFRAVHRFPRMIHWRVVERGKVLVLMPMDVSRRQELRWETGTAYRLRFSKAIRPSCVALFDATDRDIVVMFVLTTENVLYTFYLKPEFFSTLDEGSRLYDGWCKQYRPKQLTIRSPHFLKAIANDTLLVALDDGGLVRMDRIITQTHVKEGPAYNEILFSDGSFLKNIFGWSSQLRHGGTRISPNTIVSVALTFRYSLLFTVSVNHQLKVWSMERGTILNVYDLLNNPSASASSVRNFLDPTPKNLVAMIDIALEPRHMFYLLTYSPAANGTFKLWAGTDDGTSSFTRLIDLYPDHTFQAQPPSPNSVWVVADFGISPTNKHDDSQYSLWILWKSNTSSKIQNVLINLKEMDRTWNHWVNATYEELEVAKVRSPVFATAEEVTSYWLQTVFSPGRFSDALVTTALSIFEKNYTNAKTPVPSAAEEDTSLALKVVQAVDLATLMKRNSEPETLEDDMYRQNLELQWSQFFRLCVELDKERSEALSLNVDPASGLAYVSNADGITALRECTESEIIYRNIATASNNAIDILKLRSSERLQDLMTGDLLKPITTIMQSAAALKGSLTESVFDDCVAALSDETLSVPTMSVGDRMEEIYARCFDERYPTALYEELVSMLEDLVDVEAAYEALLLSFNEGEKLSGSSKLTVFGEKLILRGSQELVYVNYTMLFDLTLLLLVIYFSDKVVINDVEAIERTYSRLIHLLREYQILSFLSKSSWSISSQDEEAEERLRQGLGKLRGCDPLAIPQIHNTSVLQLMLEESSGPPPSQLGRGSQTLTASIRKFISSIDLSDYSNSSIHIAARLLRLDASRLASDFSQFLPNTHWGQYMKARISLKRGQREKAKELFKKVAFGIASPSQPPISSIDLLFSPIEVATLRAGLPKYYQHVVQLFEENKFYEEVVSFAISAVESMGGINDHEQEQFRSEMLSREFNAAIQCRMFDDAYMALVQYRNKPLQEQALRTLVGAMCENGAADRFCKYPFIGLQEEVNDALEYKCKEVHDVKTSPPFHKVLYSWRVKRFDFRGAASALYEYLHKLVSTVTPAVRYSNEEVADCFSAILNVLACVKKEQAWILTHVERETSHDREIPKRTKVRDGRHPPRRVVTIDEIREDYQKELDKIQLYLAGGFMF